MYRKYIKRILDLIISLCATIVLSPVLIALALAVKLDSKGPVFFRQKRVGMGKKTFTMLKFRSMLIDAPHDVPTHLLDDPEQYISRTGKFLRKTSLDELAQLFNIIAGDMAIVGPRPALWNQFDLIEERDKYGANDIRPGLTGLAQINGRDELPIDVKAAFDGEYAENVTLGMDIKCIIGTVSSVLRHDGVVEGGTGTIEKQQKENENK